MSLILRAAAGLVFIFAGLEKVLLGTTPVVTYFRDLALPWPEVLGPAVGWLEVFGGLALVAGVLTRAVAALFVAEMLVALAVARLPSALAARSVADAVVSIRLELLLVATCACLVLAGAGRWSVDAAARHRGSLASRQ